MLTIAFLWWFVTSYGSSLPIVMKTVYPNLWSLTIRAVFLAIFIYFSPGPFRTVSSLFVQYRENQDFLMFTATVFLMFPTYIIWTLCKVMWVKIAADNSTISFHYLYKKIEVSGSEVEKYVDTGIITKRKPINGWLIKLRSGKTIEVSEFNIRSRKSIEDFLILHKVPKKGIKPSWFPYTRKI